MKTLLVNNYSPYLDNIVQILNEFDCDFECHDCDYIYSSSYLENGLLARFDNVILSGRQHNSTIINRINSAIVKNCQINDKPLLGICYGGQILALTFGSTLKKIHKIQDVEKITVLESNRLLPEGKTLTMFESHNFCVSHLSDAFILLASSYSCKNELFCLNNKPLFGAQFHPEKSGIPGKSLIKNFIEI